MPRVHLNALYQDYVTEGRRSHRFVRRTIAILHTICRSVLNDIGDSWRIERERLDRLMLLDFHDFGNIMHIQNICQARSGRNRQVVRTLTHVELQDL